MKITGVWSVSVCCKAGYSYVCACGVAHLWLRSGLPYIWRYYLSKAIVVWCRSRASSACRLNCCLCFWYAKLCTVYQRCDACCFPPDYPPCTLLRVHFPFYGSAIFRSHKFKYCFPSFEKNTTMGERNWNCHRKCILGVGLLHFNWKLRIRHAGRGVHFVCPPIVHSKLFVVNLVMGISNIPLCRL